MPLIGFNWFQDRVMSQFTDLADYFVHNEGLMQEEHHRRRSEIVSRHGIPECDSEEAAQECFAERQAEIGECDQRYRISFRRILRFSRYARDDKIGAFSPLTIDH